MGAGRRYTRRSAVNWYNPLARGLAGFWLALPGQWGGSTLRDISDGGKNGTLTNGPTWVPGLNGYGGVRFDGTDDLIEFGDVLSFSGVAQYTALAYVRPVAASSGVGTVLGRGSTVSNKRELFIYWDTANQFFSFQRSDSASFPTCSTASGSVVSGGTYVVAATFDGSVQSIYLDGKLGGTTTNALSVTGCDRFTFGRIYDFSAGGIAYALQGDLYGVIILNRAVSAAAVAALSDQFRRGFPDLLSRNDPERWFGVTAGGVTLTADVIGGGVGGYLIGA